MCGRSLSFIRSCSEGLFKSFFCASVADLILVLQSSYNIYFVLCLTLSFGGKQCMLLRVGE